VPFIRHSRDKRGYETTYVMHAYRPAQAPQKTRVLYLFRSPSHIRIGRRPLDDEAREALEHTHPDVSFDWTVLGRDAVPPPRPEPQQWSRPSRPHRPAPTPPAPPPVPDDGSLLGRVLGAPAALRLRQRYAELRERVARRARTPEERDRLMERLQRLNPDDWTDDAAVRSAAQRIDADWDAILAELPSRRRGRRGGRRRFDELEGGERTREREHPPSAAEASGIIDQGGETDNAGPEERWMGSADRPADAGGGDGAERAEPAAGHGHGLPGDD
jgi:hypothetical protein